MFQNRTLKIALAAFLVVALVLVAYFYFMGDKQKDTGEEGKRIVTEDETTGFGSLPKDTGTGETRPGVSSATTPLATPTTSPYPGSGAFDWTRVSSRTDLEPILKKGLTVEQVAKIRQNDVCGLADVSSSWSSPFEKILCSFLEYTTFKVFDPLNDFICNLIVASLKTNFDQGIEAKITNGRCLIEDRK